MTPPPRPRIRLIATGGTIAGAGASAHHAGGYRAGALGIDAVLATLPPPAGVALDARQACAIDSKDADPDFWRLLAREVAEADADPGVDGIVVLHGTDTLEDSAWFLHLTRQARKPLVLTGAMRPSTAPSADGPMNLLQAIRVASQPDAAAHGVLVAMNGSIFHARHLRKAHATRTDAFDAGDGGPAGFVHDDTVGWLAAPLPAPPRFAPDTPLAPVALLFDHAGIAPGMVHAVLGSGIRGLVWAGYGNGSVSGAIEPLLREAHRQGTAILLASRTGTGPVLPRDAGGLPDSAGLDPYKARLALMLALGDRMPTDALQALMDRLARP